MRRTRGGDGRSDLWNSLKSEAITATGVNALEFASDELKGDWDFMMAAVRHDGYAVHYASEELQGDRQIVMEVSAAKRKKLADSFLTVRCPSLAFNASNLHF